MGKSDEFGWEAVRVPIRIGLDYLWFGDEEAKVVLDRFSSFLEKQLMENKSIFCEYSYKGICDNKYENPPRESMNIRKTRQIDYW